MKNKNNSAQNVRPITKYDDGNIPDVDLPYEEDSFKNSSKYDVEPLPESSRPRKDGPGGE